MCLLQEKILFFFTFHRLDTVSEWKYEFLCKQNKSLSDFSLKVWFIKLTEYSGQQTE